MVLNCCHPPNCFGISSDFIFRPNLSVFFLIILARTEFGNKSTRNIIELNIRALVMAYIYILTWLTIDNSTVSIKVSKLFLWFAATFPHEQTFVLTKYLFCIDMESARRKIVYRKMSNYARGDSQALCTRMTPALLFTVAIVTMTETNIATSQTRY